MVLKDNLRNADGIGEKELLAVSFGTSFLDTCARTIGAVENDLEAAFPGRSVRRAFTSGIILRVREKRDGVRPDNVEEALERAVKNGVKDLLVLPTHFMDGLEYHKLLRMLEPYRPQFEKVTVGAPLLSTEADFLAVAQALENANTGLEDGSTAFCYMGHGSEAESNRVYSVLQEVFAKTGRKNYFVGTVEATPTVEDLLTALKGSGYKRVVLMPLMLVAGDHANNDMAGDDDDSWKSVFTAAGYEVLCRVQGLGELADVRSLYVAHAKAAE